MSVKIHNFSAGPCILPQEVLQQASQAVIEFGNMGLSLIEISHRSKEFVAVMEEARSLVKELLNVPDNYSVLFLQGGASLGFLTAAYNFMPEGGKAAYFNTGTWAKGAIAEAKLLGTVDVVADSSSTNFDHIPTDYTIPSDVDYVHYTSNNTIFGTQFKNAPVTDKPLICDMSSDIFSKRINVSDYAMIYAGAQKNMGPAGTVLYIVNNDLLKRVDRVTPKYLKLENHIAKDSMLNTPPVFAVYTSMLTLRWLKKLGGVEAIEKINNAKAAAIYAEIDNNPLFEGHARPDSRSVMNATFRLKDESLAEAFDACWKAAGISGIKGHRSVGGYRASMYNALPLESVEALVQVMREFAASQA
ncbi:MAG: 3-phosphoserine/phosphohydroxythreonine transaminase [Flavobacteriales bacterium]|nr:3-phosphoserine/phosphohydroxythreonine transaminase [Flavobacteriales bacterium]